MGRGFVGLTRVLRWVGLGSLGWVYLRANPGWVGLEGAKPGLPSEPSNGFVSRF